MFKNQGYKFSRLAKIGYIVLDLLFLNQNQPFNMRQLFIFLLACSLFTACNNDKGPARDRSNNSRDRDDYRSDDKKNSSDYSDDDRKSNNDRENTSNDDRTDDRNTSSSGWSSTERSQFVNSCVSSAVSGGMEQSVADHYCNCMLDKLEKIYPNANDAGGLDVNSSEMQKMIRDCLR